MHLANADGTRDGGGGGGGVGASGGGVISGGPSSFTDVQYEQCRFPKLEECAHFHYERVQLPPVAVCLQTNMERSLHSQHSQEDDCEWYMVQVTSGDECWLLQRNFENFRLLDSQLHQCIYDRKISQLPDLSQVRDVASLHGSAHRVGFRDVAEGDASAEVKESDVETILVKYLRRFTAIADNSINCGPVLNWLQMDNKGHRLLVPSEESRSINTPAVAAAYSVRRYVSQARDELNLEVGDMISVIDMASPGESIWWRGKRGFQVGFFPQHCVHIIGDKVPRNMPLPAPVVGSLALSPIKPVLRKHGKLIAFFRSFILNRPSRRRLKQSGILRERVFGCDLGEHLLNSGCEIPTVLKCCAEFIETHGIVDGIYRLSGVTSNIQRLRNAFDEDRIPNLKTEDILQDIHSVASLLKMYFRELPNPLCTYQLYQSFVQAVQGCTSTRNTKQDHERLLKMREAVQKLPPPHYRTLEYLARHLAKVAKHGDRTGMTVRNVAIVWAPNLLRCAELEVGGVAALQGVGVQAVVTEFLICYADLIFCDNLNVKLNMTDIDAAMYQAAMLNATSPKRSRPKSLAISTPTKLITLEEARNKHHKEAYIEVGGGPDSLPKKYHTIIELPLRKRVNSKRSPLGWRSLFGKSRNSRTAKPTIVHHVVNNDQVDIALNNVKPEVKIVLRTVKSAESLSDLDQLPPLMNVLSTKPPGHNRSVSHDSYFDTLQSSHEGSLLDLSEIQVNFDLEESEMRIFSEDESLVSSPRVQPRRIRISSGNNSSGNPSPKKQPRVILSPESASRKRTRLEEQLSDIQFIDCNTPEMICGSTVVQVHQVQRHHEEDAEGPRNKSPRNSQCFDLRDIRDFRRDSRCESSRDNRLSQVMLTSTSTIAASTPQSPTPQSPTYKLLESSTGTTPGDMSPQFGKMVVAPKSPTYENVLTTISITYKSPTKTKHFLTEGTALMNDSPNYEVVTVKAEDAQIPTSTANLPLQEAKTQDMMVASSSSNLDFRNSTTSITNSLSAINDIGEDVNLLTSKSDDPHTSLTNEDEDSYPKCDTTLSELIDSYDRIAKATSGDWSHVETSTNEEFPQEETSNDYENVKNGSDSTSNSTDNEHSSNCLVNYENINFANEPHSAASTDNEGAMIKEDMEFLMPPSVQDLIEFSPVVEDAGTLLEDEQVTQLNQSLNLSQNQEKRKQSAHGSDDSDHDVYQQVKYFRRSVHEINELLALSNQDQHEDQLEVPESAAEDSSDYQSVVAMVTSSDSHDENEDGDEDDVAKVIEIIEPEPEVQISRSHVECGDVRLELGVTESLPNLSPQKEMHLEPDVTYDSLETNDYETIEFSNDSLEAEAEADAKVQSESPEANMMCEEVLKLQLKTDIVDLDTSLVNDIDIAMTSMSPSKNLSMTVTSVTSDDPVDVSPQSITNVVKHLTSKFEVQDIGGRPLPPCLRARNLKSAIKTRSLDETEFLKKAVVTEEGRTSHSANNASSSHGAIDAESGSSLQRRKSLDENMCGYKMNTLPKTLNKPKKLPDDPDMQLHVVPHDVNLNRERIEKYKEERRKYLHDKYRSESFKENKDVLLSRFKVLKAPPTKDEPQQQQPPQPQLETTPIVVGNGMTNNVTVTATATCAPPHSANPATCNTTPSCGSGGTNGVRARTAMFEPEVEMRPGNVSSRRHKLIAQGSLGGNLDCGNLESSFEAARRSFENPSTRKDRTSTSYCIKDMKAIFESKSQQ